MRPTGPGEREGERKRGREGGSKQEEQYGKKSN
jgi:hypothetical protein